MNFSVTTQEVQKLLDENLEIINLVEPQFNSLREGYTFLIDGMEEIDEITDLLKGKTKELWKSIKYGSTTKDKVKDCKDYTICLIKEALRLGSMCDKILNYMS